MTTPNSAQSGLRAAAPGRDWLYALVLVAAGAGVFAGVRWQASIAPMLGMTPAAAPEVGDAQAGGAKQLWTCGMHPQVIQDRPGACPICHMNLTPLIVDNGGSPGDPGGGGSTPAPGGGGRKVKYWWDPMMSPPYISDRPGKSPMGMDLVPVYEGERSRAAGGAQVVIDPAVVQNMGVRVALVSEGPLKKAVRLVGYLDEAQPNIVELNLRVSGWIRRLYASTEGQRVEAGDPLFDLYSPDLQVAIEELIAARRARAASAASVPETTSTADTAAALYAAAASKLELLGLDPRQIEALAKLDAAPPDVTFTSPITGDVTEKPVVEGAAVMSGQMVLRIVDHTTLWLDAQAFEKDLPFVKVGQEVTASIASRPPAEGTVRGEIVFVHPRLDPMTRTALVRVAIPNPSLALKPGMYGTVRTESQLAERAVLVPREAILDTGDSQVAFVAVSVGRFEPRRVRMGLGGGDGLVQVLEGLSPGEAVVTSGQFLIDTESRLREAIQKFLNQKTPVAGDDPASPGRALSSEQQETLDGVVAAYLEMSGVLGVAADAGAPADPAGLVTRAHALHGVLSGTGQEGLAADVAGAAEAMRGHPIDHQRERFSALGDAVIALVDALPPSGAVGRELYIMNCPMAPGGGKGDWIQASPDLANPFFGADMRQCGSLVRTIAPREGSR